MLSVICVLRVGAVVSKKKSRLKVYFDILRTKARVRVGTRA